VGGIKKVCSAILLLTEGLVLNPWGCAAQLGEA
jgi:hypothetical protein